MIGGVSVVSFFCPVTQDVMKMSKMLVFPKKEIQVQWELGASCKCCLRVAVGGVVDVLGDEKKQNKLLLTNNIPPKRGGRSRLYNFVSL